QTHPFNQALDQCCIRVHQLAHIEHHFVEPLGQRQPMDLAQERRQPRLRIDLPQHALELQGPQPASTYLQIGRGRSLIAFRRRRAHERPPAPPQVLLSLALSWSSSLRGGPLSLSAVSALSVATTGRWARTVTRSGSEVSTTTWQPPSCTMR